MTLIELFEVPPAADDEFLADWRRERGARGATLYRAIRDDVPLRFVSLAPGGEYELLHDDRGFDTAGGILQIGGYAVEPSDDEAFVAAWQRLRAALSPQRGYLASRLYRGPEAADFRFVALTRWSSPLMVARALRVPEVAAALPRFPAHVALYQEDRKRSASRG